MYRLVFCDLDGTVASFDGQVQPAVRQAMQAVVDSGAWITISTGRGFQLVKPFLGKVVINAPLICCNGGLIVEPSSRQVLQVQPTPLPLAHDLARLAQEEGIEMWFYLADMETMLKNRGGERTFVLRRDSATVRHSADPIAELTAPPHKVLIVSQSPQATPALLARLERHVGERARVVTSGPHWVEVIVPGVSKAGAMSWVARHLGVERDETLAIGDGDNDVEMLEWAALSIAMGNATPAAKAAADWIAPSVEEDGAAVALQRYLLSR